MNTLTELNTYSASTVSANDERLPSPGTTNFTRYEINGVLDTGKSVMHNIETLANSAATWVTYDVASGKWSFVINKDGTSSKSFSDDNIVGELKVTSTSLDNYYNSVEVEFPHKDLNDASDYIRIDIPAVDRKANEPDNVLKMNYPLVNEQVQAQLLGFIELKQSRVDTVIEFTTDFTAIDLQAGDLIDVTNSTFGYTNKLFRVLSVKETDTDGLNLEVTALEYDANVYSIADLVRYVRSNADGIITIGDIGQCGTPQITKFETDRVPHFLLETTVPDNTDPANPYGIVEGIEVWIYDMPDAEVPTYQTVDDESRTYTLHTTIKPQGEVFAPGADVDYRINNLDGGNFLLKVRGINAITKGPFSTISGLVEYTPKQVTDQITNDTEINDGGSIIASLGMSFLMNQLNKLLADGDSGSGGIFDKIFEVFQDETGVDLVSDASSGGLGNNIAVYDEGTLKTSGVTSFDFVGDNIVVTKTGNAVTVTHTNPDSTDPPPVDEPDPSDPYDDLATDIEIYQLYPLDRTTFESPITTTTPNYATQTGYYAFVMPQGYDDYQVGTGNAKLYKSDGTLVETISAASAVIDQNVIKLPFADRAKGTDYYITVDAGFVTLCSKPNQAIGGEGRSWNFNTAPYYDDNSYSVSGNTTTVGSLTYTVTAPGPCLTGQEISIEFPVAPNLGTGDIVITDTDTSTTFQTIAVSSGTVAGTTVTYSVNTLTAGTAFSIAIPDNAFNGNLAPACHTVLGYSNASTVTFSTADNIAHQSFLADSTLTAYSSGTQVLDSPTDFDNIHRESNLRITFNQNIAFGTSGNITIYENGSSWQVFDVSDTYAADGISETFWISGGALNLNPTQDMTPGASYYILADANSIVHATCNDVNGWAGTSSTTEFAWTVYSGPQAPGGNYDPINNNVSFTFDDSIAFDDPNQTIEIKDGTGTTLSTVNSANSAVTLT